MSYRVLVVLAEPLDEERLRLSEEAKVIEERLKLAEKRAYEVEFCHAATFDDLRASLVRLKPEILHFAGHGSQTGLLFETDDGEGRQVDPRRLCALLQKCRKRLYAVVMNACSSDVHADAFRTTGIPYLVAMREDIDNLAAVKFSAAFYDAVGAGETIETAYAQGCEAYDAEFNEPNAHVPADLHRNPKHVVRKCPRCQNLLPGGRFVQCEFCEPVTVNWPQIAKIVAAVVLALLAGYAGYAQWYVQPEFVFTHESDDGSLLHFKLVNASLVPVSLSRISVENARSPLKPEVKIGTLTPNRFPRLGWRDEDTFTVNVNHVAWSSEMLLDEPGRFLEERATSPVVFTATLERRGHFVTVDYPVPVKEIRKFLTVGHGVPPNYR